MYYILSVFSGVIIAIMVIANGQLTSIYGVFSATVFIHVIGLIFTLILMFFKKEKLRFQREIPFWVYLGGGIGVMTIVFTNMAYGGISLASIIALSLLGQCLTSIAIDQFGLFHMEPHPFNRKKMAGLLLIAFGILYMLMGTKVQAWLAVTVALLSGVSIVVARTINGVMAEKNSILLSTFYNYIVGLIVAVVIFFLSNETIPNASDINTEVNFFIYFGGVIGVFVVLLSNIVIYKISSFFMTLLLFAGQLVTGIITDAIFQQQISYQSMGSGLLIFAGLFLNMWIDKKQMKTEEVI